MLKPGVIFIFSVWNRIAENEFADTVTRALEFIFPDDPPRFLVRTPTVTMTKPPSSKTLETLDSSAQPLLVYLRSHIVKRLGEATDFTANAIAESFRLQAIEGKIQAHVVSIEA